MAELNDLARNPDSLSLLAASSDTLSKSAVGFDKAARDTWKESSKQAWAPSSRQNLSSSSSRFSGSVEPNYRGYAVAVGVVPSIESLNQFGRVRNVDYKLYQLQLLSSDLVNYTLSMRQLAKMITIYASTHTYRQKIIYILMI